MNIFYIDPNPRACAIAKYDKHVVKMVLEYAQILSTAHRVLDGDDCPDYLYKIAHLNHPSTKWARENRGNYMWLARLLRETTDEYTFRYGKIHLTDKKGIVEFLLHNAPKNIQEGEFFPPPQCMPDYCKREDTLDAYRTLYVTEKIALMAYKGREEPEWLRPMLDRESGAEWLRAV